MVDATDGGRREEERRMMEGSRAPACKAAAVAGRRIFPLLVFNTARYTENTRREGGQSTADGGLGMRSVSADGLTARARMTSATGMPKRLSTARLMALSTASNCALV